MNKGKSVERRRRKATGLSHEAHLHETIAGLPLGACFFVAKNAIQMGDREMLKGKTRQWVIGCVIAGLIASQGGAATAFANQAVTETEMGYVAPVSQTRGFSTITGDYLVWIGTDSSGMDQIFSLNLVSGEEKQLTDTRVYKESISAGGDYALFYGDRREVVLVNLITGESESVLKGFYYQYLSTDGHSIVYLDGIDNNHYVYDIQSKQKKQLPQGRYPVVADGKVVMQDDKRRLILYDLTSNTTRTIKDPADGFIVNFKFNGKVVVWSQQVSEHVDQVRMMNVEEVGATPIALSQVKKDTSSNWPSILAISGNLALWYQDSQLEKSRDLVAGDLTSGETVVLDTETSSSTRILGIYKDQAALRGSDGNIVLQTLQANGTPTKKESLVSAVPDVKEKPRAVEYDTRFFKNPSSFEQVEGHPASSDKSVSLDVPPYTFLESGLDKIKLAPADDKDLKLTKAIEKGQIMVSLPWAIDFPEQTVNEIELHMSYIESLVPANLRDKLGIFRLDDNTWVYTGGLSEGSARLRAAIGQPGIYAIFIHDISDAPLHEYWMNKRMKAAIEQEPIRVFLDGEELHFNEQPVLHESYTMVEFRTIFEKLGLNIGWNPATREVVGDKEGQSLRLQLDNKAATINEETLDMPIAPFSNEGFTFVPLRFVGEATGRKVLWDANLKAVYLYDASTEGKLFYKDGSLMYEGQLKDGKMNGKGKLYRNDGSLWYDAEFKDNEVVGWGSMYFDGDFLGEDRTGEVIVGQFKNGLPNGFVRKFDNSGNVKFEGKQVSGSPSGQVKMYIQGRPLYEGEMSGGYLGGQGKYYAGGKLVYEGGFVESLKDGRGKEYDKDGRLVREGEYKQGRRDGRGIDYYPSGAKSFEGTYAEGGRNGSGNMYYENGKLKAEGHFEHHLLVKGTYYYENGERYEGEFLYGQPNGQGILYDKDGNVKYQGTFANGKPGA